MLRENCALICESFMDKYILNAIGLEVSKDDMNNEDLQHQSSAHISDQIASHRSQMRGFDLVFKIFDHITLQDWLKVQRSLSKSHSYHYKKSQLIDFDINSKISDAVQVINEQNLNLVVLTSNEKS